MPVLSIENISKNYGAVHALKNVSFNVPEGSVYGILGPNGSGKTTLLGIVMDVLKASSGNYLWSGKPGSNEQRKLIGTLLETPNFYHYLSADDNLAIAARIKGRGLEDIPAVLEMVNLLQRRKSKFNTYSLGMKQRLAIASALLGNPDILVFDEPTNGLDPAGIAEIRELIIQLNKNGKTIIMASHILDEVEKVCTHVAIIQKGELKTAGHVHEVLSHSTNMIAVSSADIALLQTMLSPMTGITSIKQAGDELLLNCTEQITAEAINRFCFDKGIVLNRLSVKRKSLETRFLEITGNQSDR
ncbi:MAG: ABC transporter ATP-binding protein [Ferruginibacter sp.]